MIIPRSQIKNIERIISHEQDEEEKLFIDVIKEYGFIQEIIQKKYFNKRRSAKNFKNTYHCTLKKKYLNKHKDLFYINKWSKEEEETLVNLYFQYGDEYLKFLDNVLGKLNHKTRRQCGKKISHIKYKLNQGNTKRRYLVFNEYITGKEFVSETDFVFHPVVSNLLKRKHIKESATKQGYIFIQEFD